MRTYFSVNLEWKKNLDWSKNVDVYRNEIELERFIFRIDLSNNMYLLLYNNYNTGLTYRSIKNLISIS